MTGSGKICANPRFSPVKRWQFNNNQGKYILRQCCPRPPQNLEFYMTSVHRVIAHLSLLLVLPLFCGFAPHGDNTGPQGINNSAPAGIGGTGPFEHNKIDLLAQLPLNQIGGGAANILGNDCWGWTDPQTGKEYAIAGLSHGTSFVDISIPTDPKYLGRLPTRGTNSTWRDMKVYDNHVFVVSDANPTHGMQVFDLTRLRTADPNSPQNFTENAWYSGVGSSHNIAINEDTGYAYIVGSNQANGGLHVVDISNPTSPVFAGNFSADGYTHDAQIVIYNGPDADYVGREVAFCSNEDTLTIVDVTNKSNMTMISRTGYPQDAYTHQCWLSEDQRYLYLCDELDEYNLGGPTRTHIWDLLDLNNPFYVGYHSGTTTAIDHNIYIKGNMAFLASYAAGLRVLAIDPNDQTQLSEVAFFDTYVTDTDTDFDGAWSVYPYFESGSIFINDRQNGLFVVRISPLEFVYPNGRPEMVSPAGENGVFQVQVDGFGGTPMPNTGILHIDRGNGFETFPMNEISPNLYEADFPATTCGSVVRYYVSAEASDGSVINNPPNAPLDTFSVVSADGMEVTFADDFQTDTGWTVSGDAVDGQWTRGVPAGDGTRGDPLVDGDGSGACYLTDNVAGNSDVDDGSTILLSPLMDAVGSGTGVVAMISYDRWYSNDVGNAPASDIFVVEISNDDGESWVNLETVGPAGNEVSGGWFHKSFAISDFVTPTNEMRLRFIASDLGDASVVEAAVDGIKIEVVQCQMDPVVVTPDSVLVTRGTFVAGGVGELAASDNADFQLIRSASDIQSRTEFEISAVSPTASPSLFEIELEGSVFARSTVNQTIELFNYSTGEWEAIDTRAASRFSDASIVVSPTGDLSRFVEAGSLAIRARVRYQSPAARQQFASNTDLFTWTVQ
jgi:choice-of-anchor B domain-containing protein